MKKSWPDQMTLDQFRLRLEPVRPGTEVWKRASHFGWPEDVPADWVLLHNEGAFGFGPQRAQEFEEDLQAHGVTYRKVLSTGAVSFSFYAAPETVGE